MGLTKMLAIWVDFSCLRVLEMSAMKLVGLRMVDGNAFK